MQELNVDKSILLVGTTINYFNLDIVDNQFSLKVSGALVINAETQIPTKFSKKIKYIFGGMYMQTDQGGQ